MSIYEKGLLILIGITVLFAAAEWLLTKEQPVNPWLWSE